jgi:GntR family transcriptional repressor for pyruvate dehydrogenase complex
VEIRSGKGAIVKEVNDEPLRNFFMRVLGTHDPDALIDLLEVRKVLEEKSAAEAALRRTDDDLARLENLLEEMKRRLEDYESYSRLDVEFHVRLAECSKNSFLLFLTSSIRDSLVRVIEELRIKRYQSELPVIQGFHDRIFAAVSAGDAAAAREEMARHFDHVLSRIRRAVAGRLDADGNGEESGQ